jgi:hypothetical protein
LPKAHACIFFSRDKLKMAAEPSTKKRKEDEKKKCFRWTDEMHSSIIEAFKEYKVSCEYNINFDADKTLQ